MAGSLRPSEPSQAESGSPDTIVSIPALVESMDVVTTRFDRAGAIGMLYVEATALDEIERSYGHDARDRAAAAFAAQVLEVAAEHLRPDDLVLSGDLGRSEILILVFREHRDARFYRQELPGLGQALRQRFAGRGRKVFYPYLRQHPVLHTGVAVALRNAKLGPDSQLRKLADEARADARLNAQVARRERRQRILEVVLDRRIRSVYEPIVDVATRTVFGYEALARGPEGSEFHSPSALFEVAEQENLLFELDCLCRASALEGAIDYPSGSKLFLNIRPTSIHDPNFRAERLIETLARCKLSPSDVVFEISEQESISNFKAFREISDDYRGLGFQFALDDTGAGYAGLEAILELTPEFIKADRAFVSGIDVDPARQEMLSALQSVASKIGARIIGEGLDTLEELETLGELGIAFGQGWLFGKPTQLRPK
ncbi:MAG: EAL domain-containing protein [Myxococcota bacterium]